MTSPETPPSAVPREARAYQGHRAGMVTRTIAATVDAFVVLIVVTAGVLSVNAFVFVLDPRGFRVVGASQESLVGVALATAVVYLAGAWSMLGRSYGCHVMGLRVVDRRGRSPRLAMALLRAVLYVFFPLGLVWCGVVRSRKSVQDLLLGTYVVYDWLPEHRPRGLVA
jgi:uncharacterized RDD family membrane protein YckC